MLYAHGNESRKQKETLTWYPEYSEFNILYKIELGITSMMKYLIIDGNILFIILTGLMAYYVFKEYENVLIKLIGIVPIIAATFLNILSSFSSTIFPKITLAFKMYSENGLIINDLNFNHINSYIPLFIYGIVLITIIINLYLIFKKTNTCNIAIIVFLCGLFTRFILGFSPTVFASGERPNLFLYFSFLIVSMLIFNKLFDKNKNIKNVLIIVTTLAGLNLINGVL